MKYHIPLERLREHAQNIIDGKEPHEGESIARMLEDAIDRQGLDAVYEYVYCLVRVIEPRIAIDPSIVGVSTGMAWLMLRATPELRAHAFLTATE